MSRNVKLYIFLIVTSYLAGFYLVARIPELTIFPGANLFLSVLVSLFIFLILLSIKCCFFDNK